MYKSSETIQNKIKCNINSSSNQQQQQQQKVRRIFFKTKKKIILSPSIPAFKLFIKPEVDFCLDRLKNIISIYDCLSMMVTLTHIQFTYV